MVKYIVILLVFCSCGQKFHIGRYQDLTEKANKHLAKAIKLGAKVSTDSLYKALNVKPPDINLSFGPKILPTETERVIFLKDSAGTEAELTLNFGKDKEGNTTVQPKLKVKQPVRVIRVPYKVETKIECTKAMKWWQFVGWLLFALVVGLTVGRFMR